MSPRYYLPAIASLVAAAAVALGEDEPRAEGEMVKATMPVQFVVAIPPGEPPQHQKIYLSSSLDGWPAGGRPLRQLAGELYTTTLDLPRDKHIEYKYVHGMSWETVEQQADGGDRPNRRLYIPTEGDRLIVFAHVERWADRPLEGHVEAIFDKPVPREQAGTLTGDIRTHAAIEGPGLQQARDVLVYLPPGYDEQTDRHYPVLYMHDGQNVFDAATSFAGVEWGVDEAAEQLIKAGKIAPCIIVGIANTRERMPEYTPFVDSHRGGGQGDTYLRFIVETLKPKIDKTYRTHRGRESTYLAGSSLGGLITLYAATAYGDTFSRFGVVAPSLQWAEYEVLRRVERTDFPPDTKIWVEVGIGDVPMAPKPPAGVQKPKLSPYLSACRWLREILERQGLELSDTLHYAEQPGEFHSEGEWQRRTPEMLEFLIGPPERSGS